MAMLYGKTMPDYSDKYDKAIFVNLKLLII